jgi:hypothetical protein
MRRLVVCCDGTWNTSEQMRGDVPCPTNVVRIFHALEQSADQLCYYHPGVGTGAGLMDKLAGGSFGTGLSNNVKSAYAWLAAALPRHEAGRDVGGGHPQTGLSDCALSWMIKEAQSCVPELRFRPDILAQIRPDPCDVLHDDSTGFYRFLGPTPRATPFLDPRSLPDDAPEEPGKDTIGDVHVSAYRRQAVPPIAIGDYRKGRVPDRGETVRLDV